MSDVDSLVPDPAVVQEFFQTVDRRGKKLVVWVLCLNTVKRRALIIGLRKQRSLFYE
jgi:hypothetical protein